MCSAMERCRAGGQDQVWQVHTMPRAQTGQQKVQLSIKTKNFAHLGMLFIYVCVINEGLKVEKHEIYCIGSRRVGF